MILKYGYSKELYIDHILPHTLCTYLYVLPSTLMPLSALEFFLETGCEQRYIRNASIISRMHTPINTAVVNNAPITMPISKPLLEGGSVIVSRVSPLVVSGCCLMPPPESVLVSSVLDGVVLVVAGADVGGADVGGADVGGADVGGADVGGIFGAIN